MSGPLRILAVCSALAAVLVASPLARLGHTHGEHVHCADSAEHLAGGSCHHHDHHAHASDEPTSDRDSAPAHDHDCPTCQALAMPALAASHAAPQLGSDRCAPVLLSATPVFSQAILLAYHVRGPPR